MEANLEPADPEITPIEELAKTPGAQVEHDEEGNIRLVRMPPEYTGTDLHPSQVEGYEPRFDRSGTHRRVLQHVTDEVDITKSQQNAANYLVPLEALGPRNTVEAIAFGMARDTNSHGIPPNYPEALGKVQGILDDLSEAGLVAKREDGSWEVTEAGLTELRN